MANLAIPREQVHDLAEACSDAGDAFQSSAGRLLKEQRTLSRFFEKNFAEMGPVPGQVSLYMLSVVIRIFEQVGGRLKKVNGQLISESASRIQEAATDCPSDTPFPEWAKSVEWRAQPHILDEVIWALYEREDEEEKEEEVKMDDGQSAMIYMMLWAAVEALDARWSPPSNWAPEA